MIHIGANVLPCDEILHMMDTLPDQQDVHDALVLTPSEPNSSNGVVVRSSQSSQKDAGRLRETNGTYSTNAIPHATRSRVSGTANEPTVRAGTAAALRALGRHQHTMDDLIGPYRDGLSDSHQRLMDHTRVLIAGIRLESDAHRRLNGSSHNTTLPQAASALMENSDLEADYDIAQGDVPHHDAHTSIGGSSITTSKPSGHIDHVITSCPGHAINSQEANRSSEGIKAADAERKGKAARDSRTGASRPRDNGVSASSAAVQPGNQGDHVWMGTLEQWLAHMLAEHHQFV
jgi:hypothetical protein